MGLSKHYLTAKVGGVNKFVVYCYVYIKLEEEVDIEFKKSTGLRQRFWCLIYFEITEIKGMVN